MKLQFSFNWQELLSEKKDNQKEIEDFFNRFIYFILTGEIFENLPKFKPIGLDCWNRRKGFAC